MPRIQCDFTSETLALCCSLTALLPQRKSTAPTPAKPPRYPVLWLLHGLSDDHTIWTRRTSLERYLSGLELAVIMPAVHRSYYTDQVRGGPYFKFIADELPALCQQWFPISTDRSKQFVAGLSMGGYGAFKLAFTHPDRYAAAASLSGALDVVSVVAARAAADPQRLHEFESTFGPLAGVAGSDNDLRAVSKRRATASTPLPDLYQCCGTEDFLYQDNVSFRDHLRALQIPFIYEEGPGCHNWEYWDRMIGRVLQWLPVRRDPETYL